MEAISLIDAVLGVPSPEQARQEKDRRQRMTLASLGLLAPVMGGIETKGCHRCGGTMYRTVEPGGGGQWICSNTSCGAME
jgi:hypothetical protein